MPDFDLGGCCACGGLVNVRNLVMLSRRAPQPGTGWGCVQCGLPADGATAAVCDSCLDRRRKIILCIDGRPLQKQRIALDRFPDEPFDHDPAGHPELRSGQ